MKIEKVFSPINDPKISSHLNESPIWKSAYHQEEITPEIKKKFPFWFVYHIKLDGTVPIHCTNIEIL
jgi:hypothetical protein